MATVNGTLSFGIEIEAVRLAQNVVPSMVSDLGLAVHADHSIKADDGSDLPRFGPGGGVELVTPVLTCKVNGSSDGKRMVIDLGDSPTLIQRTCDLIGHVNKSCGVHLHLGKPSKEDPMKSTWEPEKVRTALIIGKILEPRLLDLVDSSRHRNETCARIDDKYTTRDFGEFYPVGAVKPLKYDNKKRYTWINLIETVRKGTRSEPGFGSSPGLGTMEIRLVGNTSDFNYIMAWTRLWLKIAAYIAYVPTSLAVNHCCFSDSLHPEFDQVRAAFKDQLEKKNSRATSQMETRLESITSRSRSRQAPESRVRPLRTSTTISQPPNSPLDEDDAEDVALPRPPSSRTPAAAVEDELNMLQTFFTAATGTTNTQQP